MGIRAKGNSGKWEFGKTGIRVNGNSGNGESGKWVLSNGNRTSWIEQVGLGQMGLGLLLGDYSRKRIIKFYVTNIRISICSSHNIYFKLHFYLTR